MLRELWQTESIHPRLEQAKLSNQREQLCLLFLEMQRSLVLLALSMYENAPVLNEEFLNARTIEEVTAGVVKLRHWRERLPVRISLAVHRWLDHSRWLKNILVTAYLWGRSSVWAVFPGMRLGNYRKWIHSYDRDDAYPMTSSDLKMGIVIWEPSLSHLADLLESIANLHLPPQKIFIFAHREILERTKFFLQKHRLTDFVLVPASSVEENLRQLSESSLDYFVVATGKGTFSPHTLSRVAIWAQQKPNCRIFYADEDRLDFWGRRVQPKFHPDWSYDYLLGQNCFENLAIFHRSCFEKIQNAQNWHEFLLDQVLSRPETEIGHIPQILFHSKAKPSSGGNWSLSLKAALEKRFPGVQVVPGLKKLPRAVWPLPAKLPKVSIIIPTRDRVDLLKTVIRGLTRGTDYAPVEIIIVDNQSQQTKTHKYFEYISRHHGVKIVKYDRIFNYSAINNVGFAASSGEIIVLMNNDLEVISSQWLKEMVRELLRRDVGAVGAKLYYKNGYIQHAGVIMGIGQVSNHAHAMEFGRARGYCNRLMFSHCYSAVTGACMAIRRETFEAVGGLDEDLAVAYNDVDLCLRIRQSGLKIIWTPFAELYHHESATRQPDRLPQQLRRYGREVELMRSRWEAVIATDPYYNLNLTNQNGNFHLAFPPRFRAQTPN